VSGPTGEQAGDAFEWRGLAREAAAAVPPGDPFSVGGTALPAAKARQERLKQRMLERGDRLGELVAGGLSAKFEGSILVSSNLLDAAQVSELRSLAPEAEEVVFAELTGSFDELRSVLANLDPLHTTAQISFNHTVGVAGMYHEPTDERSEVSVEIVASVFASQVPPTIPERPASGAIQQIEDLLETIRWLQQFLLVLQAWNDPDEQSGYLRMIGRARLSTVRGESYASHGQELALAVLGPLADQMRRTFGCTIEEFLDVSQAAHDLIIDRVNDHGKWMATVFNRVADASAGELADVQRLELSGQVQDAFDQLHRSMTFTADDVTVHGGLDAQVASSILQRFSITPGELEKHSYRSALDLCPFSQRPFLRSGDEYVLPIAGQALRSPLDVFEHPLLATWNKFSKHRADVVDALALRLLVDGLTGCESFGPGAYYEFDDGDGLRRYETDGIVVFEGWVLIVEGKANSLSRQSHRGDLPRLGRDIAESLRSAWNQCARVQRYLTSSSGVTFENERGNRSFTVAGVEADRILFVNPMLHTLGAFAFEMPRLESLVEFESEGVPWPTLITDLRVITELARPAELLHYLRWRSRLPLGDGMHVVDELDIFGSYLFGGIGGPNPDTQSLVSFASSTTDFDEYYFGLEAGGTPEPPRRVLGDWLEGVLDDLDESRPAGWLKRSFQILDLTLTEAALLTSFAETVAPQNIGSEDWYAERHGDVVSVALAAGIEWTQVLLEVSPIIGQARAWFAIQMGDGVCTLAASGRKP